MLDSWKFSESRFEPVNGKHFGSGYPSDPKCKDWTEKNLTDPVFCFPDLVRFSWGPAKVGVEKNGVKVEWEADDEDEDGEQLKLSTFFKSNKHVSKKQRFGYFEENDLNDVSRIFQITE
mmetsp:Transcript_35182/g.53988  ORF Transcript_35182/g.53988 Transcript_35182/m.53988 type:complete len:119 (+) Transcript_35182:65-421(+)